MGAEIDRLEVQVEAEATKANNQLDIMERKLNRVATAMMNVNSAISNNAASSVFKRVNSEIQQQVVGLKDNARSVRSLATAFSSAYVKLFAIKKIGAKLFDSAKSSMGFLETVNYFEVAMRDIGNSAAERWTDTGKMSAEAYAESFSERAKQLTEKMTGYSIDSDGNASYLGNKNLGMDPDKVLQYQATYAQVSASMGVAEESALNFSKALTMLGADWASLRNLTFEQSWEKFASALAGQSRAIRSLGIDITNATLQEYAYKNGLDMAVSEMNQATKAQLRLLAILDQSKVAYGDLANTIESPSNQLRMLQQNASNLARVFGNLFVPVLEKALPIINGATIALQNLFEWFGRVLGIEFKDNNSSYGENMNENILNAVDGADELEGALSDADKAAKKLKNTLQGWHEINNITSKDASSDKTINIGGNAVLDGAISSALEEYEKKWNEAFERMENKAQQYAEKFGKYLEPVKKIISDFMIGDYFQAGEDTSNLISSIFDFIDKAIDNVDWEQLGQNFGEYLKGLNWTKIMDSVGKLASDALWAALDTWIGMFETSPIETLTITFGAIAWKLGALDFTEKLLAKKLSETLASLGINKVAIGNFALAITVASVSISWAVDIWKEIFASAKMESTEEGKSILRQAVENMWLEIQTGDFHFQLPFGIQLPSANEVRERYEAVLTPALQHVERKFNENIRTLKEKFPGTFDGLQKAWTTFEEWFDRSGVKKWYNDIKPYFAKDKWTFEGIKEGLEQAFNNGIAGIKQIWNKFANWLNEKLTFSWKDIKIGGVEILKAGKIELGKIPTFSTGGFPEDGLFMANHSELVGKFANGKNAVANNQQITDGIEEAAYRGVSRALAENPGRGTNLHIEGDPHGMFRVWLDEYKGEAERIQGNPIPIYN